MSNAPSQFHLGDIVRVVKPKDPLFGQEGKVIDSLCYDFGEHMIAVEFKDEQGTPVYRSDELEMVKENTEPNRVFLAAMELCGRKDINLQRKSGEYGRKLSIRFERDRDGSEHVRFYAYENVIASISSKGRLMLTDAGWHNVMTREGLKQVCAHLPIRGHFYQKNHEYWYDDGTASRDPMMLETEDGRPYGPKSLVVDVM